MSLPVHSSRIIEIDGEIMRGFITSNTPGTPPYLYELDSYECNGQCGCPNFKFKLEPKVSRKQNIDPMWCKHLEIAFAMFGHRMVKEIVASATFGSTVARRMAEGQFKMEHHQHD